jgi:peptidoglycan/xylan/chitin deacetylase (PgdA/CDA1 family)
MLAFVALAVGAAAIVFVQPGWAVSLLARRSPDVLYSVETRLPLVALTIDDGPDSFTTAEILHALAAYDARATFFLIGDRVRGREPVVSEIVAAGHELGNHLSRDEPAVRLPPDELRRSLLETDSLLAPFARPTWMRPGSGWYDETTLAVARAAGYRLALGSIYPYDAEIPSVGFAAWRILRSARPGSVVVLHDGGSRGARTAEVLRRVLPELERRGLGVVTLSALVAAATPPPQDPARWRAAAYGPRTFP